jgi:hypothetical protein
MTHLRGLGAVAFAAGAALGGPVAFGESATLVLGPDAPGQELPAAGRSLFDELFATGAGYDVPYPFERLLDALNARVAPARAHTALIPLGRSLQRYAADPDYFGSPRLVVAIDADGVTAIDAPLMRDRLFLGYQPAAEAIEVISYNETAGRFEFQEITDYGAGLVPRIGYAARDICVPCHQGHGPIFSRPLWSETNANPAVVEKLAALGASYHGAPVREGVDALDDLDLSTDRANRVAVVNRLWSEGCGEDAAGAACRAALLKAALVYRLTGARTEWRPAGMEQEAALLQDRVIRLWPGGLAIPSPDLPNRDPLAGIAAAQGVDQILEPQGPVDPRSLRVAVLQWRPAADPATTFAAAARDVAGMFATADIVWLDRRLAAQSEPVSRRSTLCRLRRVALDGDGVELRAECNGGDFTLAGFVTMAGAEIRGGRIDALTIRGEAAVRRLRIGDGSIARDGDAEVIRLVPREDGAGLSARLLTGARLAAVTLRSGGESEATAEIDVVDDLDALDLAVGELLDTDALGPGPFRRRGVLAGLDQALAMR